MWMRPRCGSGCTGHRPLDTDLTVTGTDGSGPCACPRRRPARRDGRAGRRSTTPVPAVSLDEARAAAKAYHGFIEHPFPTCYVCGPRRDPDDRPAASSPAGCPTAVPPPRSSFPPTSPARSCGRRWTARAAGRCPLETRAYVLGELAVRVDALPPAGDRMRGHGGTDRGGRPQGVRPDDRSTGPPASCSRTGRGHLDRPALTHLAATSGNLSPGCNPETPL